MIAHDDAELRRSFEALRRDVAAGAPAFAPTVAAARIRRPPVPGRRILALAGAAAAVTVVVLAALLARRSARDGSPARVDLASVRWRAPTDFLLTLPGDELLRTVPRLGYRTLDGRTL
jgi:hypothetical protein